MSEPFDPFNPEHVKAWHERRQAKSVAVGLGLAVLLVAIGVGVWLAWKLP